MKNKIEELTIPGSQEYYYKATVINTVILAKHKMNGKEKSPEIDWHIFGQLIFNKDIKWFHGERIVI